ncbi:hypothetical protein, partial [Escherichia coli]|uniref:hypothetical protein n=1 Tax=Escherichia coli TaxID=562 RepID=UPI001C59F635
SLGLGRLGFIRETLGGENRINENFQKWIFWGAGAPFGERVLLIFRIFKRSNFFSFFAKSLHELQSSIPAAF